MWIRQVTAGAFGPHKGQSLDFAPGLTVVVGANEAGKSSWHAATYAGLCGLRRAKGRRIKEDELFAARHQPWDGGPWEVSTVLVLADGRTVELRHDLSGQISSSARDLDLGHDVTHEIINDGAPDGSVWLGLDRRAFAAVACVRQAEILAVIDRAEAIQDHLQRAAATAGADETAAAALAALDQYHRDHVGLDRANSTKPLRIAIEQVRLATDRHQAAVNAHNEWLHREEDVARLERAARTADYQLRVAKAARAQQAASQIGERVAHLDELARLHPTAPPALASDDDLAAQVTTAIHAWHQRPSVEDLVGPSAAELERQLDELPSSPTGDLDPHPSVVAAHRVLVQAATRAETHREHEPVAVEYPPTGGADAGLLEELAEQLSVPVPEVASKLEAEVARLQAHADQVAAAGPSRVALVISMLVPLILAIGAGGLALVGQPVPAVAAAASALVAAVLGLVVASRRKRRRPTDDGGVALAAAQAELAASREATAEGIRRRSELVDRVEAMGLNPDPAALRRLIHQLERADHDAAERQRWVDADRHVGEQVTSAAGLLVEALVARKVPLGDESGDPEALLAVVERYEHDCRQRREVAEQASARPRIESELRARVQIEQRVAADSERLARIEAGVRAVGLDTGVVTDAAVGPAAEIVERLKQWEQQRAGRRADRERAQQGWLRLQTMLDGRTLADWHQEATRVADAAAQLGQGIAPDELTNVDLGDRPEEAVRRLNDVAVERRMALGEARRELTVRAESVDPVAETAEALAAAQAELGRVRRLEEVLETTHRFMATAQQRVHRDLAPVLAERVKHRLEMVTGGRYRDVIIDPQSLTVHVRDPEGRLRDASYLSQGTAEQVFLLLRVAMAEILTTDSCPLLLDDVTVQSDPVRTRAVLDVLHQVSADHQVVLFSQEADVAEWARASLGDRDSLVELEAKA